MRNLECEHQSTFEEFISEKFVVQRTADNVNGVSLNIGHEQVINPKSLLVI